MVADHPLDLCVNTQTPLLQFSIPGEAGFVPSDSESVGHMVEGVDYRYSPGGVTRMLHPLLRRLRADGVLRSARWVSLNPYAPRTVPLPDVTLENVRIDPDRLHAYGNVKETIWGTVHGLRAPDGSNDLFWSDDYSEYAYYNRLTAERIRRLDAKLDFDLFYVHDFQQLPIGSMLGTLKPRLFRWHIPFEARAIPEAWKEAILGYLAGYDRVVVSTNRYLRQLRTFGFRGKATRLYPYVDPEEYSVPSPSEVRSVAARYGIREGDRVLIVVGRMDPMKGQDHAIRALARLRKRYPRLRLLLVGNGSFSGSQDGLGLDKTGSWRHRLEEMVSRLGLEGRVLFTGHVNQRALDACYERAEITILPSVLEGFGLVVVESWIHRKPAVVSSRAGVAELIRDRRNGVLADPIETERLADRIEELLQDPDGLASTMVQGGRATLKRCSLESAVKTETALLTAATEG